MHALLQSKYLNSTVCGAKDVKFLLNQKSCYAELCKCSFSFHSILCRKWSVDLVSTVITVLFLVMEWDWQIILHPASYWRHVIDMFSMTWRKKKKKKRSASLQKGYKNKTYEALLHCSKYFSHDFFFLREKISPLAWDTAYICKKTKNYVVHMLHWKTIRFSCKKLIK